MQSDATKRGLFNHAVETIDYYCPVRLSTPKELVFFWLAQLSLPISLFINLDYTISKIFSDNCSKINDNMSNRVDSKELVAEKKLVTEEKLKMEEEIETKDLEGLE